MSERPVQVAVIGGHAFNVVGCLAPVFKAAENQTAVVEVDLGKCGGDITVIGTIDGKSQEVLRKICDEYCLKVPEPRPFKADVNNKVKGNHIQPFYRKDRW